MKLELQTERHLARAAARSTRHLVASVTAPRAARRDRRLPVNVALVLDRSGSMAGDKISLAREAVRRALHSLDDTDRFSLVVYDNVIDVLVPSTPATGTATSRALAELDRVDARGSTDLCTGWLSGCEQVASFVDGERVSRVLLLTDGLANVGVTDRGAIARHADELRRRGVQTSTFGVGDDFDERLLRDMARAGSGNFYFIQSAQQIPDLLASELGEALEVVARGATLEVALPHGATAKALQGFRHFFAPGDRELRIELGDLVSGQQMDVVVAIELDRGVEGAATTVDVTLSSRDTTPVRAEQRWTYASHVANDEEPRDRTVDRIVAALYAARARAEAAELNRAGQYEQARRVTERTARKIRSYAGTDRELNRIADELLNEGICLGAPMEAMALKQSFFAAETVLKERARSGRAKR